MTVLAPVPAPALAEVAGIAQLRAAGSGSAAPPEARGQPARGADQITIAPPPTARTLMDLATAGLRQLGTVLPALERMMADAAIETAAWPVGHLARTLGDAAHSIDIGAAAMAAGNQAGAKPPSDAWRQAATGALHDAADLLARAEQRLGPASSVQPEPLDVSPSLLRAALREADLMSRLDGRPDLTPPTPLQLAAPPPIVPNADMLWAMSQVVGAQRQVGLALGSLSRRTPLAAASRPPARGALIDLRGAIALAGIVLIVLLFAIAETVGTVAAGLCGGVIAGGATLAWGWRVVVASRRLRLELRR